MSDWPTIDMGNLQAMMVMRQHNAPVPASNGFDPYQAMLRRKKPSIQDESGYINTPVQEYDAKDIQELEEFCTKYGVVGFNFGTMNPKAALRMLKGRMGVREEKTTPRTMLFG